MSILVVETMSGTSASANRLIVLLLSLFFLFLDAHVERSARQ